MTTQPANVPCRARRVRALLGFTIIELMVAMLLGLIVIAGVTSVFLANQRVYRTNTALADVESASRIAFEMMARDIREAGVTGCNSHNDRIVNVLNNSNNGITTWWADWSNAVHGYDNASSDPALAGFTAADEPKPVNGTSSVQLIGAGGMPMTIKEDPPGANFKLNSATDNLAKGDIIMVCSPDHAAILQISNYNPSNVTVGYNKGNSVSPGNCSTNLGYPNNNCTGNSPQYTFPPNSQISKLTAVDWYIGSNPADGKSLYRATLTNSGGSATVTAQEMVRNVTDMDIEYLVPTNSSIAASFQTAGTIAANSAWPGVAALRVTLTLESHFKRASADGSDPVQRSYTFTTAVRNRLH